ncbi:MAG: hypothetical protein IKX96_01595, partial [Firmicutes bacterium]|nr:hypothetical protein [Bacillota bacterium]
MNVNKEYKDRLFKAIFASPNHRQNALVLYNALNGTDYKNPEDLEVYTIDDVIYMGMRNDFSFILDDTLNLYEHQSSFSPNMPLRGLFYFSKQYEKYIANLKQVLYSSKLKMIPTPVYVVFYNGDTELEDEKILKLSDAYINKEFAGKDYIPSLEVKALLLNINYGRNAELMEQCKPLMDYSKFVSYVKMYKKEGLDTKSAVEKALNRAIRENLLDGYFERHRAEVIDMILSEYDEKATMQMFKEEGYEEGCETTQRKAIIGLLKSGVDVDIIAKSLDV